MAQILHRIHEKGGRFLTEDGNGSNEECSVPSRNWVAVGYDKAVDKTRHRLRVKRLSSSSGKTSDPRAADPIQMQGGRVELDSTEVETGSSNEKAPAPKSQEGQVKLDSPEVGTGSNAKAPTLFMSEQLEVLEERSLFDLSVFGSVLDGELAKEAEDDLCGKEIDIDSILSWSGPPDLQTKSSAGPGSSACPGIQESPQPEAFLRGTGDSPGWELEGPAATSLDSHRQCSDIEPLQSQYKRHMQLSRSTVKSSHAVGDEAHSESMCNFQNLQDLTLSSDTSKLRSMPSPVSDHVETNLRQWINENIPRGLYSCSELNDYIMTALSIAVKLAETLAGETILETELDSCSELSVKWSAGRIVDITARKSLQLCGKPERLASLGKILYELFSGRVPPSRTDKMQTGSGGEPDSEVDKILALLLRDGNARSKRRTMEELDSQFDSGGVVDRYHSELMTSLNDVGLPVSLLDTIKNLLDCCRSSELRTYELYSSFDDVLVDLKLVRDNPDCFLSGLGNSPTVSIPSKLYGRQHVVEEIVRLYESDDCSGLIVNGRAGVGKSSLLLQVFTDISKRDGRYFLRAKFEQAGVNPLAVIASMFDSLCDAFLRDSHPHFRYSVAAELESALGSAGISALSSVIPSISRIVSSPVLGPDDQFMNRAASLSYSFKKLLEIVSSHSVPIIVLFDDLQFVSGDYSQGCSGHTECLVVLCTSGHHSLLQNF